jgi:hypothetical protein
MANRWKGNLVANAATSSGTAYTGKADGAWGLNSQLQQNQAGLWARGIGAPQVPTNVVATAGNGQASISFTAGYTGGGTVTYTATSTPSGITATSASSPITVTGLTNGTAYTFTVRGTNTLGYTSAESSSSNSVTPLGQYMAATFNDEATSFAAYEWTDSGFGGKYADPSSLPVNNTISITATSTNNAIIVGSSVSPFVTAYPFSSSGIGTKFTNPTPLPTSAASTGQCLATSNTGSGYIFVGQATTTPAIVYYQFNGGYGFGSKLSTPSGISTISGRGVAVNSVANTIAIGLSASPSIAVYPFNDGFGSKYADAATINGQCYKTTFNPAGNVIICSLLASGNNRTVAYAWNNGFGAKYADPSTPLTFSDSVNFSPDGLNFVATWSANTYPLAYPWNNGFGTKYADPATSVAEAYMSATFNSKSNALAVNADGAMGVRVYSWSSGFGTVYANPSTVISGLAYGIIFN